MKLKEQKGNLLECDAHIICQVVNCQGVMNSGLAGEIRRVHPEVFDHYKQICDDNDRRMQETDALLGKVQLVKTRNGAKVICNMFAQDKYGKNKRYLDYEAFYVCLEKVRDNCFFDYISLGFPKFIGCGLAGGSWPIVFTMIQTVFKDTDTTILIVEK